MTFLRVSSAAQSVNSNIWKTPQWHLRNCILCLEAIIRESFGTYFLAESTAKIVKLEGAFLRVVYLLLTVLLIGEGTRTPGKDRPSGVCWAPGMCAKLFLTASPPPSSFHLQLMANYIQKLSRTSLLELWRKCPFCISFMLMKTCSFPRQTSGWILCS